VCYAANDVLLRFLFCALSHELIGLYAYFIPLTDFLPATVFFGPLRVRAFVFVF
jgi:hypothetical protein